MNTAPKYLNLLKIKLPAPGIVSILHRLSGLIMILSLPLLIACLGLSLHDADGFASAKAWLASPLAKLIFALVAWSLIHHMIAGIRFLLIDVDLGVEKSTAQKTAYATNGISVLILLALLIRAVL